MPDQSTKRNLFSMVLTAAAAACCIAATALANEAPTAVGPKYSIGTYYYPGWRTDNTISPPRRPWDSIQAFPEREPLLGWYDEGDVNVMDQQLKWMHDYGLSFVVFDWYWTSNRPRNQHALEAYMKSVNKDLMQFAIMWANHENYPKSMKDFRTIVQYWVTNFLQDAQYQRINGQPVVHIFSPTGLEQKAQAFGSTTPQLLAEADGIARQAGLPGIYFVAGTPAGDFVKTSAQPFGYEALSAYNYGLGRSFAQRDLGYQRQWRDILNTSTLPYFPPITAGWDRSPWGGTIKDPGRDLAFSTPDSFETHLRNAKKVMDENPERTMRSGIICCWNEYGEGSVIEPTKGFGMQYLERVQKVFGE